VVSVRHRTPIEDTPVVALDLSDQEAVLEAFAAVEPSIVIHAAYAMDEASIVDATRHVAAAARSGGAHVIFVSSDAVFPGDGSPSHEDAIPNPIWDYGRWKAEAEQLVASTASATIIRLPLIVSTHPEDHVVRRITSSAQRGERTSWFVDEFRQPALASDLAPACWRIASLEAHEREGVWHLPGPETLSRFEIAQRVVAALDLDPASVVAGTTPADAQRPRHLHLGANRAVSDIGWRPTPVLA